MNKSTARLIIDAMLANVSGFRAWDLLSDANKKKLRTKLESLLIEAFDEALEEQGEGRERR